MKVWKKPITTINRLVFNMFKLIKANRKSIQLYSILLIKLIEKTFEIWYNNRIDVYSEVALCSI